MTKISKRITQWLLAIVMAICVCFGIAFTLPQKTASADSVEVTWQESFSVETNAAWDYTRFRINTNGETWTSYNNQSYADNYLAYTTLNGRTVKEINAAATAAGLSEQIHACLQPGDGTFSFYSVCVPHAFTELLAEDIYSFSVEAGWSHLDSSTSTTYPGTGNTYTNGTAARWVYRDNTFKMNTGAYADFSTASLSFGNQGDQGNGSTCFILNTGDPTNFWTKYTPAFAMNNPVLNAIYINGKSINDWNAEAQAAVDAGTATDILYGSTASDNTTAGAPIAVVPGYANNTANGAFFQIYIANNFLPASAIYSFEWKAGFAYTVTESRDVYYTSKDIRFDLLGSGWRAITEFVDLDSGDMKLIDQGISHTGVNCFLIGFGGDLHFDAYYCMNDNYAKASPLTGLTYGENLDYITINGKTIGQIKAENPDYDYSTSAHGNIKNGGVYAPIFTHMSKGDIGRGVTENYIQIFIPTDLIDPSTVTEIGLDEKIFNLNGTVKYGLTEDITFMKKNGAWVDTRNMVSSENTTISEAYEGGNANELYKVDITSPKWTFTCNEYDLMYGGYAAQRQNVFINGVSVYDINANTDDSGYTYSTFPMTGADDATFAHPVIFQTIKGGNTMTLWIHKDYMETLNENITVTVGENFTYGGVSMLEEVSKVVLERAATLYTVTVDGVPQTVTAGECAVAPTTPTKAEDENYTYTFDNWYIVDTDTVFDFSMAINQDYDVESRFTAHAKVTEVAVSFTSAVLDKEYHATYGYSVRINTEGLQWATSHNWVAAEEWASIADYTLINGKTVTEINAGIDGQKLTLMMQGAGTFSFLRVYIPEAVMPVDDVKSMGIKAGWTFENEKDGKVYTCSSDAFFYNQSGAMVAKANYLLSSDITISKVRVDGSAGELYKVDITSAKWNSTCDSFDYNYPGYVDVRQNLFINGVSVHTINTTVDDSAYVYSTSPMTNTATWTYGGKTYDTFKNPVLLQGAGDTLTLWIHKDYIDSLATNEITVTLGIGFVFVRDSAILLEETSKVVRGNNTVTVDGVPQTVTDGGYAVEPETPADYEEANYVYTFDNWYIVDTDEVFDFSTAITQDYDVESRFIAQEKVQWNSNANFEPNIDKTPYTRIRFNTPALAWTVSANEVTDDCYVEYTRINGRTIKEINAASSDAEKIVIRLQPAGSFSFYGIYIPDSFTELPASQVLTVTIDAGWSHKDSATGKAYINSTAITWYNRFDNTLQQNTGAYKDINATADFTFSQQSTENGSTCFILNTKDVSGLWTTYGSTIKLGNPILNYIYINDKSIAAWNADAQAAVDAGAATNMLYGSTHGQNTNAGAPIAVLPGYANAEAHGAFFQIYIATNFLAAEDVISIEWKADFEMMHSGTTDVYYMSEGVRFEKRNGTWLNAADIFTVTIENYDGTLLGTQEVVKGDVATAIGTPTRPMTPTSVYTFIGWKDSEGNDFVFGTTQIMGDVTVIAQYTEQFVAIEETSVLGVNFQLNLSNNDDNWLVFTLSNHDYTCDTGTVEYSVSYEELQRIGLLDNIILKGELFVGTTPVSEATLAELLAANGAGEGRFINYWGVGTIGVRVKKTPAYNSITEIVVKEGAYFPSYQYACLGNTTVDVRFMVISETVFTPAYVDEVYFTDGEGVKHTNKRTFYSTSSVEGYDISMAEGAAIRIAQLDDYDGDENYMETTGYKQSGIRFQTNISKTSIAQLQSHVGTLYESVSFGTLIVPAADLMGGSFTHEWLNANGVKYMDIASTAWLSADDYAFASEDNEYVTFYGSIVNLKVANHSRSFAGVGYIAVVRNSETTYYYAPYSSAYSRSATFIAQAAVADRYETYTEYYKNKIDENNNYSPYTVGELAFLKLYMGALTDTEVAAESFTLTSDGKLASDVTSTRNTGTLTVNKKLNGAYVQLNYQTNIDVWGKFYYKSASSAEVAEDFYLQKGTSQHKQFLDLFRTNGVGYGLTQDDLYLTKITFQNATVDTSSTGTFKFLGLYSKTNTLDTANLEVYVTKALTSGGDMTVGAHLGIGGALTYLAKSGISEWTTGTKAANSSVTTHIGLSTNAGTDNLKNGSSSSEAGTGVNLINNYDAGRQIQQSWYANVGGSLEENTGANGYTRLDCDTGDGGYWPYNPVQAGDCVSNPAQIVDYEVNEAKGYIYVKSRAMDWAYGDTSKGGKAGGVTTKSYMENYYRLNADGTLFVNNSFIDWNGFTNMDECDFCLVELPAFYPVHPLNKFFTYDGASPWTGGGLTRKDDLSAWTSGGNSHYQSNVDGTAEGKVGEEWVAWANDTAGTVALGIYIPNVERFLSGRSETSSSVTYKYSWITGVYAASGAANGEAQNNLLSQKGLMSNMPAPVSEYDSVYVSNTSYTAPGIRIKMEAYVPIEYTYVLSVNDIETIRNQFKDIHDSGKVTNAGSKAGDRVGLDAWDRADKLWTQF